MNKRSLFRSLFLIATASFFVVSCDKDFNEIGSDVIGDDHFDFLPDSLSTVVAYNKATGVVQTNNQVINSLGIYNNPVFGKTKANFVTQLQLATVNPTFDKEKFIKLDSVVLSVPYFSTKTETATDGKGTYELDSIYGSGPISLKVFESGVVLNDLLPPDFQNAQRYYSDEDWRFDSFKIGAFLNNQDAPSENTQFDPSNKEIKTYKRDKGLRMTKSDDNIEARLTPRMRLHLNPAFFEAKILNAPSGKLINNSVFKEYFKGLYFQVEDAETGKLMQLKFSEGDITLHYREYSELVTDPNNPDGPKIPAKFSETDTQYPGEDVMLAKTFVLKMTGNTVNLLKNSPASQYLSAIQSPNMIQGDEKLYVKGGEGSMTVIDLFGPDADNNGIADELEAIRASGWLINEANLTFHIDKQTMAGVGDNKPSEPQRVYLFDLKNRRPLIDFYTDATTVPGLPKLNKYVHDGLIKRENVAGGRGTTYRVRITNHIRNLVRKDSTNVQLGLVVTESISEIQNAWLKLDPAIPNPPPAGTITRVPQSSVMNPLGTVLWGNTANVPEEKKLKLKIYYTKPN